MRVPGVSRAWGRWRTKDHESLGCTFVGKPAQFNLSRVDGIGRNAEIKKDRNDGCDLLSLHFTKEEEVPFPKLKELLREHLNGFREVFENEEVGAEAG